MYNIMSWDNKFRVPVSPYSVCSFSFFLKVIGVNLLKVHAPNVFAYGRMLLDTLFT